MKGPVTAITPLLCGLLRPQLVNSSRYAYYIESHHYTNVVSPSGTILSGCIKNCFFQGIAERRRTAGDMHLIVRRRGYGSYAEQYCVDYSIEFVIHTKKHRSDGPGLFSFGDGLKWSMHFFSRGVNTYFITTNCHSYAGHELNKPRYVRIISQMPKIQWGFTSPFCRSVRGDGPPIITSKLRN